MPQMPDNPGRAQIASDEARIDALLRAVEAAAPSALTYRLTARNSARRWWRSAPALSLGLAGAASAACVALILALTSGGAVAAPTVLRASLVGLARSTATAPHSLTAAGTRIAFPDWSARGWPSSGTRSDHVGGRTITTVFYRSTRFGTLGYAIVAGAPLRHGARGVASTRNGEHYVSIAAHGEQIVTWVQDGHTCILASRTASLSALWDLAVSQRRGVSA
jgi:hypothetical protein